MYCTSQRDRTYWIPVREITVRQVKALVSPRPVNSAIGVPLPQLIRIASVAAAALDLGSRRGTSPCSLQAECVENGDRASESGSCRRPTVHYVKSALLCACGAVLYE